uniref:CTP_transf_like domain-containing protein n=1 Tax=Mesocestoides corti TaxID=53468 RepID=A0A5K3EUD2_MESCO
MSSLRCSKRVESGQSSTCMSDFFLCWLVGTSTMSSWTLPSSLPKSSSTSSRSMSSSWALTRMTCQTHLTTPWRYRGGAAFTEGSKVGRTSPHDKLFNESLKIRPTRIEIGSRSPGR